MTTKFYPDYSEGTLHPQSYQILQDIMDANYAPLHTLVPQQARIGFFVTDWLGVPLQDIKISNISTNSGIPLRIYSNEENELSPILVFFHGGGFVVGELNDFDAFCTYIANNSSCIVVSVDYRLAPENKFPCAISDVENAIKWIYNNAKTFNGDPSRIAVAGDSAGGNLAAYCSFICRDRLNIPIVYQILICPWLDLSNTKTESYSHFGKGLWLPEVNIDWYRKHYVNDPSEFFLPQVSPLLSSDFSGLPPTLIISAEFDVLKDEAYTYSKKLLAAGNKVKYSCYNGMLHDFVTLPGLFDSAYESIDEISAELRNAFLNK